MYLEVKKKVEFKRGLKLRRVSDGIVYMLCQCNADEFTLICVEENDTRKTSLGNRYFDNCNSTQAIICVQKLLDDGEFIIEE